MTKDKISRTFANWLDEKIQPNVYIVLTLKQSVVTDHFGSRFTTRANPDIIETEVDNFISRLSKLVYGKKTWKRFRKRIPSVATLEGDGHRPYDGASRSKKSLAHMDATQSVGADMRYHLNVLLHKPDHISFDDFEEMIMIAWFASDWSLADIYIQERVGDCVAYSLKDGPEAILVNSISF